MSAKHTPGIVSEMPFHDGDGYSWGGDIVVTIGSRSINLGTSQNYSERQEIKAIGHLIAAASELLLAGLKAEMLLTKLLDQGVYLEPGALRELRDAIAKVRREG